MDKHVQEYLNYLQASLADASRLAPDLTARDCVELTSVLLLNGKIDAHNVKALLGLAKCQGSASDDRIWPIPVLVCPQLYGLRPHHGYPSQRLPQRIAPIVISARLGQDGKLTDDNTVSAPVLVSRNLLEPTPWEVSIGTVDEADAAYAKLASARSTWSSLLESADHLLQALTGRTLPDLEIPRYEPMDIGAIFVRKRGSATFSIEALLDRLLGPTTTTLPLLESVLRKADDLPLFTLNEQIRYSAAHTGQMECRYGLAESQREALIHHLSPSGPHVLAVDGPPGTGKTTLLLSMIATAWVEAAQCDMEPPLIVATSTNNQAVLNILRAFAEVPARKGRFAGRWLDKLKSYGLYLPASTKEASESFPVHAMAGMGREAVHDAQTFESLDGFHAAKESFLQHARAAFPESPSPSLRQIRALLKSELQRSTDLVSESVAALEVLTQAARNKSLCNDVVADLQARANSASESSQAAYIEAQQLRNDLLSLRSAWTRHCADEALWITLLAALRIRTPRLQRDIAFWANAESVRPESLDTRIRALADRPSIDAALLDLLQEQERNREDAQKAQDLAEVTKNLFDKAASALRRMVPVPGELTVETVQAALDIGPRFDAFEIATHYWEVRYLQEVEEQLALSGGMDDSRSPDKLLRQYRRLAKLFPCFVATLYTLPRRFTAYLGEPKPLYNAIDLLIVDEAGQVPVEIGTPSFALAKRAVVVGDVDQIKPIWSIPRALDLANAERHQITPRWADSQTFHTSGLACSANSLMQLAQRATPFVKHPKRGRGMFLSEHRRCWPEIIAMCNHLVYQGLLLPRRPEGARRIVPSVGYAHIPGLDTRHGGSRSNGVEAMAIAKWLKYRRAEIESAFKDEKKSFGELVAIVTPFSAQARALRSALDQELGRSHGLTVGTVHALQGAERRIVVFSPTHGLGTRPGSTFFDTDSSILNVAISRAQDAFLVFGNMHLFQPKGSHPSATIGRLIFGNGSNEISDVPPDLLAPGIDMSPAALIRDLPSHRSVLEEAFQVARTRLVIVSPFVSPLALQADGIPDKVRQARTRGVNVTVVSDPSLNTKWRREYEQCINELHSAGARVVEANSQGVHSKLILVDRAWLVVGSFNWLSAVRDEGRRFARYESSLRFDGPEAFQMIGRSLSDLKEVLVG